MTKEYSRRAPGGGKLYSFNGIWPKLGSGVFIAPGTRIIGDVEIGMAPASGSIVFCAAMWKKSASARALIFRIIRLSMWTAAAFQPSSVMTF
ncbi:MAG: hypothetical protein JKY59_06210 [Emcibacter sp.]|nr:hypothetical protein [Emcibacter sp.]